MTYQNSEPIRLGLMPPLTGLVKIYGTEIVNAARIACLEINRNGGLLGRPLELVIEDDGSLPVSAIPAALRLVEQHRCVAIIGNLLSNSRIAVANQVAEAKQIPYLNFSFYEGSISSRYFFHFAALPNQQIDKMIPYMASHFGLKMFFAGNNYEWPRGSIDAAKRTLKNIGGDIVGEEYLPLACSDDAINTLLEAVARSGADVFIPYFAGSDQISILTRFTAMGLKQRMAVVMGHFDEVMVSQLSPQIREGFFSSNTYFMSIDTAENRQYLEKLAALDNVDKLWPQGNGIQSNFGEATYVCVKAFAKAVEESGSLEAAALVNALEHIHLSAPQGEVEMDAKTHHAKVNSYLARCNADGTFSIIEKFGCIAPQIPERYRQQNQEQLHESLLTPQLVARLAKDINKSMTEAGTARQILAMADMAILATDASGNILESNHHACILFGYSSEEFLGMPVSQLLPPHLRQNHAKMIQKFVDGAQTQQRMGTRTDVTGYRKDGTFFPLEASIAKIKTNANEWMLVVTLHDITERKRTDDELLHRATHDALTGLPNRILIRDRLTNALERSLRTNLGVAVLFIDLDEFKLMNDTHGHATGDALLKEISLRILQQVRPGDTVARLAGDEFVILCEQLEPVGETEVASLLAERINLALRQPVVLNNLPFYITASIGIATGHGSTHSADDLLRSADTAMYAVKGQGRNGWQFFSSTLQMKVDQRMAVTQGLRNLQNQDLSARFQPIVSIQGERIVGAELLLRWHPPSGEISPAVFIPVAEAIGAIISIGAWVFRRGCEAEASWRQRWGAHAPSYISINVSARQLNQANLAVEFANIIKETGADPSRILLEVTETSLMADVETNLRVLKQLTDLGMRVAVDDFGTGYSSLAQLTRMPVSVLKIDKAFIDGIETHADSRTVVRAVIGLGRALGLKMIAEGVENEAQLLELRSYGCDFIQGYYFHRPLDEKTFIDTINKAVEASEKTV